MNDQPEAVAEVEDQDKALDEPAPIRGRRARIEAGVAPTEMETTVVPAPADAVPGEAEPAAPLPTTVDLTGPQVAEIRQRNDAIDEALREAQELERSAASIAKDAERARLLAQYAQEALSQGINNLITASGLDPAFRYQIDLKRGRIIPAGPIARTP